MILKIYFLIKNSNQTKKDFSNIKKLNLKTEEIYKEIENIIINIAFENKKTDFICSNRFLDTLLD